jgi:hypothetical protein
MEMDFWTMRRRGDVPLVNLEFRCDQCRSIRTEWVVSGRDLLPRAGVSLGQEMEENDLAFP